MTIVRPVQPPFTSALFIFFTRSRCANAGAVDLKFPRHLRQDSPREFQIESGTGIMGLLEPFWFSKVVAEGAAMYSELRKPGTRAGRFACGFLWSKTIRI
jgi:hypothetical protein